MRLLTIDASVFVSAARPGEDGHRESLAFLAWVRHERPRLFLPTLSIIEISAALRRTGVDVTLAQQYAIAIGQLPNVFMVGLDEGFARQASALAAQHQLRGADAVYVATAAQFAAELVTLDLEQRKRSTAVIRALTPKTFMATV